MAMVAVLSCLGTTSARASTLRASGTPAATRDATTSRRVSHAARPRAAAAPAAMRGSGTVLRRAPLRPACPPAHGPRRGARATLPHVARLARVPRAARGGGRGAGAGSAMMVANGPRPIVSAARIAAATSRVMEDARSRPGHGRAPPRGSPNGALAPWSAETHPTLPPRRVPSGARRFAERTMPCRAFRAPRRPGLLFAHTIPGRSVPTSHARCVEGAPACLRIPSDGGFPCPA